MDASLAQRLAMLPKEQQAELMKGMSDEDAEQLLYKWEFWARPDQLAPVGDWNIWLICAGRGWGKGTTHETILPTPSGWTTMGDLSPGDTLFDEAGVPCRVIKKYTPEFDDWQRLTFSDGNFIDTSGDHQWVTWTHAERKAFLRSSYEDITKFPADWPKWRLKRRIGRSRFPVVCPDSPGPRIRTTAEIIQTLKFGKRGDTNHCIPCCGALELPEVDLPVPPYTLGYWLGNGCSGSGTIAGHQDDTPFIRGRIHQDGFETTSRADIQTFGVLALACRLRNANLIQNKHVPSVYLRASKSQRLSLLQGLMDSDGGGEAGNHVSFCNTNIQLVNSVEELVHSLGMKCTRDSKMGRIGNVEYKQAWRIQFPATLNPFTLPRKAADLTLGGGQSLRNNHRMIVSAEPIPQTAMSCITVDSPNSMFLAGRAMIPTHNTRCGVEWVRSIACGETPLAKGKCSRIAIVGETAADCRDVIVEGDSGILNAHPKAFRPIYQPSIRRLTWPNGAVASLYNATEPDQLRGPQHDAAYLDEIVKWKYSQETWDMLQFGLRLGDNPRQAITTTPRPVKLLKDIMAAPGTHVTRGSTLDNRHNLSPKFIANIVDRYAGTRLGRQELNAEILDDVPGALWSRATLDEHRRKVGEELPDMQRIVVAIDPAATSSSDGDSTSETGIVVAALGVDGRGYIIDDRSCRLTPQGWAKVAVSNYDAYQADYIVAEVNQGGEMVSSVIRAVRPSIKVKMVRATRGKVIRAEPISALYEQGKISHIGSFPTLEDQMLQFTTNGIVGDGSSDRTDALVWALTELFPSIVARATPKRQARTSTRVHMTRSRVTGY